MSDTPKNGPSGREWGRICATLQGLQDEMKGLRSDYDGLSKQFADFRQRFFVTGALILGIGIGIGVMISPALANVLLKLIVPA